MTITTMMIPPTLMMAASHSPHRARSHPTTPRHSRGARQRPSAVPVVQPTARSRTNLLCPMGEERPLIPLTDAQTMLADAIRRCHERFICILDNKHGNAYSKYYDYTGCIKTVQTIADNALQSSDYASACGNLRLCIHEVHALLLSSENDDGSNLCSRLWMIWRCACDAIWRMRRNSPTPLPPARH